MVAQQLHVRQTVRELKREGGGMAELALPCLEHNSLRACHWLGSDSTTKTNGRSSHRAYKVDSNSVSI